MPILGTEDWGAENPRLFVDKERCAYIICHGLCSCGRETQNTLDVHFFSETRYLEIFRAETSTPLHVIA